MSAPFFSLLHYYRNISWHDIKVSPRVQRQIMKYSWLYLKKEFEEMNRHAAVVVPVIYPSKYVTFDRDHLNRK